jgi:hypothetical protein
MVFADEDLVDEVPSPCIRLRPTLDEDWLKSRPEQMSDQEAAQVLPLLHWTLKSDPAELPTTAELLEDEWFKSISRKKD